MVVFHVFLQLTIGGIPNNFGIYQNSPGSNWAKTWWQLGHHSLISGFSRGCIFCPTTGIMGNTGDIRGCSCWIQPFLCFHMCLIWDDSSTWLYDIVVLFGMARSWSKLRYEHCICSSKWTVAVWQTPNIAGHCQFPVATCSNQTQDKSRYIIVCSCNLLCLPGFCHFFPCELCGYLWRICPRLAQKAYMELTRSRWFNCLKLLTPYQSAFDQPGSHTACKSFTL
jgi:hypothetical protein